MISAALSPRTLRASQAMILNILYTLVRFVIDLLLVRGRRESYLRVEVLALRHQLRVLERQRRRPRSQPADRLLLASFGRLLPGSGSSSLLPSPKRSSAGTGSLSAGNGLPSASARTGGVRVPVSSTS